MANIQQKHIIYAKIQETMTCIWGKRGNQATETTFEGPVLDTVTKTSKFLL